MHNVRLSRFKAAAAVLVLAAGMIGGLGNAAYASNGNPTCTDKIMVFPGTHLYSAWGRCTGTASSHYYYNEEVECHLAPGQDIFIDGPTYPEGSTQWSKVSCPDNDYPELHFWIETIG